MDGISIPSLKELSEKKNRSTSARSVFLRVVSKRVVGSKRHKDVLADVWIKSFVAITIPLWDRYTRSSTGTIKRFHDKISAMYLKKFLVDCDRFLTNEEFREC